MILSLARGANRPPFFVPVSGSFNLTIRCSKNVAANNMEEADQLCRQVAIIDQGHIVALDAPARLKIEHGESDKTTLEDVFVKLTGKSLYIDSL